MKRSGIMSSVIALALTSAIVAQQAPTCASFAPVCPPPGDTFATQPAPRNGTVNTAGASMTQSAFGQGTGPVEYWAPSGAAMTYTHSGPTGALAISLIGSPLTNGIPLGAAGSLDINLACPIFAIYDDFAFFGGPPLGGIPAGGVTIPYSIPAGLNGYLASVQGANIDPSTPGNVRLTARNDIGGQNLATLGTPEQPPMQANVGVVTPIGVGTTTIYPFPRDAICPNNGVTSSAVGANDGTLFSALGVNFDATAPGVTTAAVNGIPVDIFCVRPFEILFYLRPAHRPTIGGPMLITSTGGTDTPSADQMESWVIARPSTFALEPLNAGFGPAPSTNSSSGTFATTLNVLQAVVGTKDVAGQDDYYTMYGLTTQTIRAFSGEYDVASGQIQAQCSGLAPIPAAPCYLGPFGGNPNPQPYSQQWFANNNPLQDTYLLHGFAGPPNPGPGNTSIVNSQDDGGPGTNSMAGMSQIPTSATQPGLDPDGPWSALGADVIVNSDFPNPQVGSFPYQYMTIIYLQ